MYLQLCRALLGHDVTDGVISKRENHNVKSVKFTSYVEM
jgi:hypothetical protein